MSDPAPAAKPTATNPPKSTVRIAFLGDINGAPGRMALAHIAFWHESFARNVADLAAAEDRSHRGHRGASGLSVGDVALGDADLIAVGVDQDELVLGLRLDDAGCE